MPEDVVQPRQLARVLDDVAGAVGGEVALLGRLAGGVNAGAVRVRLPDGADAVLKAVVRAPGRRDEVLRAQRVVEHMRRRGYPTPAWLAVGETETHVWHLMEHVDARPSSGLTPAVVDQLMGVVELQAGQASEPHDHSAYAWRVATGREPVAARVAGRSGEASTLVDRLGLLCADVRRPLEATDMVHADLNPSNVLVRAGAVVAVVDIENAGSGTRATDLTTVLWHTFHDPLDGVRERLWTRILALVGWEGAAVLVSTQVLLQLDWSAGLGRRDAFAEALERSHRAVEELDARR